MMFNYWIFYFVLFSSILPLIVLVKTNGVIALTSIVGQFIAFRFLTDFLCFCFETYVNNSNPLFHVTLPLNFLLIFRVFSRDISLKKIQTPVYLIVFITAIIDIANNTIFGPITYNISVTYFLISIIGSYVIYHVEINSSIKYVIFPVTFYYSVLFFYSLFEVQIQTSTELFESFFLIHASITLLLNLTFTRGLWLKKVK